MLARCRAFYQSMLGVLATCVLDLRWWLWKRLAVPIPARDGWIKLLREVIQSEGAYAADGAIGAPIAWSLFDAALQPIETTCAVSGVPISPTSDPFGVRCARCGVPLACTVAGMRVSTDVPSCVPCRPAVRRVIRHALN